MNIGSFLAFHAPKDDDTLGCTGYCEVIITTNPLITGRDGNKVKILTVSARRCSSKNMQ